MKEKGVFTEKNIKQTRQKERKKAERRRGIEVYECRLEATRRLKVKETRRDTSWAKLQREIPSAEKLQRVSKEWTETSSE